MKILNNEKEYKRWMLEEYIPVMAEMVEPEVVEAELQLLMPGEFPCIAHILKSPFLQDTTALEFITRNQVREWAKFLDMTL